MKRLRKTNLCRLSAACLIGAVAGWVLCDSAVIGLMRLCMALPLPAACLCAYAVPLPAAVCVGFGLVRIGTVFGTAPTVGFGVIFLIPLGAALYLMHRRTPYFRAMRIAAAAQLLALLLGVLYLYLRFHMGVADLLMSVLGEAKNVLPAEYQDALLQTFGYFGLLEEELARAAAAGTLSAAQRTEAFALLFDRLEYLFKLSLPSFLLTSSLLTGVLIVALPTRIHVSRGDEPVYPHVPLHEWFMPANTVVGLLAALVTSYVILWAGVSGADAAMSAISATVYMLFMIQGVAALDRLFRARGWGRMGRAVGLALMAVILFLPLRVIGALSMLFGRRGAVTLWLKKRQEENDDKED